MPHIITFYSFKGGVGRTMALANVACSLASKANRVLAVDWDLEAPGLHRYFATYERQAPLDDSGTLGMLEALANSRVADSDPFESKVIVPKTDFFGGCKVNLLSAGMEANGYERRVLDFDLEEYYRNRKGASKLEELRESWRQRFDFVLIDSRTGITDAGGICTIFLPDTLALVFTANDQSLVGAIEVAKKAQKGRQALPFDRRGVTILPIPSRFDSRTEQDEADHWMKRFSEEMAPFLSTWCPREIPHRSLLERIKIPHVPYFSFGEKLPIVTHTSSDPDLPGFYYQNIANILEGEFGEGAVLSASGIAREFICDISRIIKYAPAQLLGRDHELNLLNNAWTQVRRGDSTRANILSFVAVGGEGKTSLVAKWAAELAHQDWPGCEAAFAWSFYSQGRGGHSAASSDVFLKEALTFFGDHATAVSAQAAFDKGRRLAQLVGTRRALLILDGLEPLQYAPTAPTPGELKDQGLVALLKGLATSNQGLCILTTPYSIPDLRAYWQTTAPEIKLSRLSSEAGVQVLKMLGVNGTENEFEKLVEDVSGHALTLNLLGTYLRDAHGGDIRKRDLVKLEEADAEEQGGFAFRLMDRYVRWFQTEGEKGESALAILKILGLFDRPATADLFAVLLEPPVIPDLTEPLVEATEIQRSIVLKRLEDARLLTVNRDAVGGIISLDSHPLLREYFAHKLRTEHAGAWRAAHRRLYEYLCATTNEGDEPTLGDLQPLYQAVAHGCQAGLQRRAREEVHNTRIGRGPAYYSVRKLGAFGSELWAISFFFAKPWTQPSPQLEELDRDIVLEEAAFCLRALGRLTEALEPMREGLAKHTKAKRWQNAAMAANNLSELELTLGQLDSAVEDAERSVTYADRSGAASMRTIMRATYADALHQVGRWTAAKGRFREAELMQAQSQPEYQLLYTSLGFKYCELLLAHLGRAAWQEMQMTEVRSRKSKLIEAGVAVSQRALQTLKWVETLQTDILSAPLDHLTLGRTALYRAILDKRKSQTPKPEIENAVTGLRRAGQQQYLPLGLLTRAWLRFFENEAKEAQVDLDEAWEIAERGPMKLFMADIHLYRARLFHSVRPYPWNTNPDETARGPKDDLAAARKLIEQCGYWRRKEELEDAETAAKNW